MVLTKDKISKYLIKNINISKKDAKNIVELFFNELKSTLIAEEIIKLSGFGNFYIKHKKEHPGRNPKNGEIISIQAKRVVMFKCSQKLKNKIRNISYINKKI